MSEIILGSAITAKIVELWAQALGWLVKRQLTKGRASEQLKAQSDFLELLRRASDTRVVLEERGHSIETIQEFLYSLPTSRACVSDASKGDKDTLRSELKACANDLITSKGFIAFYSGKLAVTLKMIGLQDTSLFSDTLEMFDYAGDWFTGVLDLCEKEGSLTQMERYAWVEYILTELHQIRDMLTRK